MNEPQNDYGRAASVDAEAIGQPGQRRFRLVILSGSQAASIWMEKQQLASIGEWFEEMEERLAEERPNPEPDVEPSPVPGVFALDFRAIQIGLGYQEDEDLFSLHAFDAEALGGEPRPALRVMISRGQARVLARKIAAVVAAGRPICPLCETPMDPEGHVCPKANGHHAGVSL